MATDVGEVRDVAAPEAGAARPAIVRADFARIIRVDEERREVELCATSEAVDSYGTVFGYEASKDAFTRWAGNVREMHARKAVGRRVAVRYQDAERRIFVRVRISRGAADTWEKIKDGTLRGASIGASNVQWRTERRDGRDLPVARRYDLVELSLVDLPSNPDAQGIAVVRDGVPLAEQLDVLPDAPDQPDADPAEEDEPRYPRAARRAGDPGVSALVNGGVVAVSGGAGAPFGTGDEERAARAWPEVWLANNTLAAGQMALANAAASSAEPSGSRPARAARLAALGAPGYAARPAEPAPAFATHEDAPPPLTRVRGPFSDNPDGPPDVGVPARAEESTTVAVHGQTPEGNQLATFHNAARAILLGCGCLACGAALAALDGDDSGDGEAAQGEPGDSEGRTVVAAVTRALAGQTRRLDEALAGLRGMHSGLARVAGTLEQIERRVAVIEEQPVPGGPQLRAAEKTHALQPDGAAAQVGEQLRALRGLAGRLSDPQAQIAVATEIIRLQQEAAGLTPAMQMMPRAGGRP